MSLSGILNTHFMAVYLLKKYGTDEQKQRWLPQMATGELRAALSMSEPGAGSDVQSIQCRAVRDGDHYVVNGTKIFTSGADAADYVWLAVRTDPAAPKHKGISILIVDTKLPGFSHAPIAEIDARPCGEPSSPGKGPRHSANPYAGLSPARLNSPPTNRL